MESDRHVPNLVPATDSSVHGGRSYRVGVPRTGGREVWWRGGDQNPIGAVSRRRDSVRAQDGVHAGRERRRRNDHGHRVAVSLRGAPDQASEQSRSRDGRLLSERARRGGRADVLQRPGAAAVQAGPVHDGEVWRPGRAARNVRTGLRREERERAEFERLRHAGEPAGTNTDSSLLFDFFLSVLICNNAGFVSHNIKLSLLGGPAAVPV